MSDHRATGDNEHENEVIYRRTVNSIRTGVNQNILNNFPCFRCITRENAALKASDCAIPKCTDFSPVIFNYLFVQNVNMVFNAKKVEINIVFVSGKTGNKQKSDCVFILLHFQLI